MKGSETKKTKKDFSFVLFISFSLFLTFFRFTFYISPCKLNFIFSFIYSEYNIVSVKKKDMNAKMGFLFMNRIS